MRCSTATSRSVRWLRAGRGGSGCTSCSRCWCTWRCSGGAMLSRRWRPPAPPCGWPTAYRRHVRFLFKPGWIAFVLVVIAFAVACYTLLAPWQFRRNAERSVENTQIAASFANPPRPLAELVPAGSAPSPSLAWRQASVRGEYLAGDEAVVRLRTVLGRPAFEVLTAFRTDDGRIVAVDRGYVRPGEDRQVTEYPPAPGGTVTLVGRIQLDESDPQHRASFTSGGHRQLYATDSQLLAAAVGTPVSPGYLELLDNQPGGVGVLPLPDSDSGPFLSYA